MTTGGFRLIPCPPILKAQRIDDDEDIGGATPFMPPEQTTDNHNVAPAADQYSLYYLLTESFVYELPRDVAKQLPMILQDPIVPLDQRRDDLPKSLSR